MGLAESARESYGGERRRWSLTLLVLVNLLPLAVVLHVAIIAGGIGVIALGEPVALLLALVLLKLAMDVGLHLREHRAIAGAARG